MDSERKVPYTSRMDRDAVIALGLLLAVGCGGTVSGSNESRLDTRSGQPGSGGSGTNTQPVPTGSDRTIWSPSSVGAGAADASSEIDCLHGDVGSASPEVFSRLNHQREVCVGQGSECLELLEVRADCGLTFQLQNQSHEAVADAADCAALARFATSAFLFAGLNDTTSCLPGPGNPMETTEVELTTGPGPRKKTSLCQEEPLVSLRACVLAVRNKYFAGE